MVPPKCPIALVRASQGQVRDSRGMTLMTDFSTPATPSTSDTSGSDATSATGNLKPADAKPEPLVGEDRATTQPVKRIKRKSGEVAARTDLETHGAPAVVDAAISVAIEADEASPKDQPESAEAVDQGNVVRPVDVEKAELDAASHAERLARVEDELGSDNVAFGVTAAGNKSGDHTRAVEKASEAAAEAPENVKRARAFEAVADLDTVDSPHGRVAEEHDPWVAERWAPHGDLNVPAVSYGPEEVAVYGDINPQRQDQIRGLEGDTQTDVQEAKRDAGPGASIASERHRENEQARVVARDSR